MIPVYGRVLKTLEDSFLVWIGPWVQFPVLKNGKTKQSKNPKVKQKTGGRGKRRRKGKEEEERGEE